MNRAGALCPRITDAFGECLGTKTKLAFMDRRLAPDNSRQTMNFLHWYSVRAKGRALVRPSDLPGLTRSVKMWRQSVVHEFDGGWGTAYPRSAVFRALREKRLMESQVASMSRVAASPVGESNSSRPNTHR